ncbi:MAG: GIY-YIG nuclease family protein [Parcubacteria group bacterium]
MRSERSYYLYIMTNTGNATLYTGVTGNLTGRVLQHKKKGIEGFTKRYNLTKLVYYEEFQYIEDAIRREKQIKAGSRKNKMALIKGMNPNWQDLSDGWYDDSE